MQSTGQTSMHSPQRVQLHGSMAYSFPLVITASSGQMMWQLSQFIQMLEISKVTCGILLL